MIKRITIELDMSALSFDHLGEISISLATLEKLSTAGVIHMTSEDVAGRGRLRKSRSDKLDPTQLSIHPQEAVILAHMRKHGQGTVSEMSATLGIAENSVRGNLHSLMKKRLATKSGSSRPTLWRAIDQ